MLISIRGEPAPELWAAADVAGYEFQTRPCGDDKVSVYASGYIVAEDLKWYSYGDLVAQLRELKSLDTIKTLGY
jgi:hypothetical protein